MDDETRVQLVLGILIFGGTLLGLALLLFLRWLDWLRNRRERHTLPPYQKDGDPDNLTYGENGTTDPYVIAEEALKLVDRVCAENARLKRQIARLEAKHPHGGTLSAAQWLTIVNDDANLIPHVGIEGATRTGKTTLATGILHDREGRILIITAKTGDAWGGLPHVTIDDDGSFTAAAATFRALNREVLRRLVAAKHGETPGDWLTVVLDDYPALRDACPEADAPFLLVARVGASLRVRLMVLTYSLNVKELGLEGKGDARRHFVWIKCARHGSERTATMQWEGQTFDLETGPIVRLASRPLDTARAWTPEPVPQDTPAEANVRPKKRGFLSRILPHHRPSAIPDALLGQLLTEQWKEKRAPVSVVSVPANPKNGTNGTVSAAVKGGGIAGIAHPDADTGTTGNDTEPAPNTGGDTGSQARDLPDVVIRALLRGEKWSSNRIAACLYGSKQKRLQRIEAATTGQERTEEPEAIETA